MNADVLSHEAEEEWLRRALGRYAMSRDRGLRDEIAARADWLAARSARRFSDRGEPFDDLVQEARIGLLKAIERFDLDRSVPFGAYATPTIIGELRRHFRDRTWAVHVSRGSKDIMASVVAARDALALELGRSPRVPEIATRMNLATDTVIEALEANDAYFTRSLESAGAQQRPVAEPAFENVVDRVVLSALLDRLAPRQRRILQMRFFEELTQSEIALRIGTSQVHVGRLIAASIAQLNRYAADAGTDEPPTESPPGH
ncbi:MAG: sigma-70 family RNA polymerase sigma factor [Ilumatobacteraceae bacterium]